MTTKTESAPALTYESTSRVVRTHDYEIQVNEAGEGHPVLLIHGTGPGATGWSNFAQNIEPLSRHFRVIAVTMPGWGESSPQSVESGFDQGEAVKQLMDALDIERAAIVGNSMGGGIGIIMTARWPERVSHLITMGSGVWGVNVLSPAGMTEGFKILVETYEDPSSWPSSAPRRRSRIRNTSTTGSRGPRSDWARRRSCPPQRPCRPLASRRW